MKFSIKADAVARLLLGAVVFGLWSASAAGFPEPVLLAQIGPDTVLERVAVPGVAVSNEVLITVEGDTRVIRSNGIPDHPTGQFPGRGNPNRIAPQRYQFRVPLNPRAAATTTPLAMGSFGVAVNGVVFDPFAAEWWHNERGWQYEPMSGAIDLGVDKYNAHVQPNGAYHYHSIPVALVNRLTGGLMKMALVGWAGDGFPIYGPLAYSNAQDTNSAVRKMKSSYQVKQGTRSGGPGGKYDGSFIADYEYVKGAGDLDECNGRFGVTLEFPQGTYYYVLTDTYPYIPRFFRGVPDDGFKHHGPPGGGRRQGGPGGGPGGPGGPGGFGPPPGGGPPPF